MSSAKHHIVFSSYPEPGSEESYHLSEPLHEILNNCALFIEEATALAPNTITVSRMRCNNELEKYYFCEGEIELIHFDKPDEIHWKCCKCGENSGIITEFKGTHWDLSEIPAIHAQQYLDDKYGLYENREELFPGFPYDLSDRKQNREFFTWLENLEEDKKQEFAEMLTEKFIKREKKLAESFNIGLDFDQIDELLQCNWYSSAGPMILNENLPFEEIEHTFFYRNARIFLLYLLEEKTFELTQAGNLKRKYINRLLNKGRWLENYVEHLRGHYKVLNEMDVWQLHMINVLLQASGLVKKRHNKLKLSKKYIHLVEKEHAGMLYKKLFCAYFRKVNMLYWNWPDDLPLLQEGMAFTLYRLHELGEDWSLSADLLKKALLETVRLELFRSLHSEYDKPDVKLELTVLRPLGLFGLIEARHDTTLKPLAARTDQPEEFRKTAIFNRFIKFHY